MSTGIPADAATCADCLRELLDPRRPPLPLSLPQLHQLRPALHHHAPHSLRPPANFNGADSKCAPPARPSTTTPQSPLPRPAQRLRRLRPARLACGRATAREIHSRPIPSLRTIDRLLAGEIMAIKGIGGFHLERGRHQRSRRHAPARAQASLRQAAGRHGARSGCRARCLRADRRRRSAAHDSGAAHRARAPPRGLRHRRCRRAGHSLAGRLSALRAACSICSSPIRARPSALVMTSANLSEEPIAIDNDEARARLGQHRRRIPDARPRNPAALRRFGHGSRGRQRRRSSAARAALSRSPFRCRLAMRRRCSPSAAISKTSSRSPAGASPTRASISATSKTLPASTSSANRSPT